MTGRFVAFVGLPGAGKSSVCRALARALGGVALTEPVDWPPAVTDPRCANGFTALSWSRSMRVPMYHQALRERDEGRVAILDTYYDKVCRELLGAEGMDWFLSPMDPLFDVYREIARHDWASLPLADVMVAFELTEPTWRTFVGRRNRTLDDDWGVCDSFAIQRHFLAAAEQLRAEFNVPVLTFRPGMGSPDRAAAQLLSALRDSHIL